MDLKDLQRNWDAFGKSDPFWSILSDPDKRGNRWNAEEFFRTGETAVAGLMEVLRNLGAPCRRDRALDFGCGAGRLTQALANHFELACGVDIAPSMVDLARRYNRRGERCRYFLNEANDLALFPDGRFDLVFSFIVLQHMKPEYSRRYLREFFRVLAPGGLTVFQLPSRPKYAPGQTACREPLPAEACRAELRTDAPAGPLAASTPVPLAVSVHNAGPMPWPSAGDRDGRCQIKLGDRWRSADGSTVLQDDGRAALPRDLLPGQAVELHLLVTPPAAPGRYVLELDLVQELVAWFGDRGSAALRLPVLVVAGAPAPQPAAADAPEGASSAEPPPRMEMYGVERDEVLALAESCGGRLLKLQEDGSAGPEWESYFYYIAK